MFDKKKIKHGFAAAAILSCGLFFSCKNPDVPGLPKNNQKVIIGDSIFGLSGVEKLELAKLALENSRGYAQSGDTMAGITEQYGWAKNDGPIRTIVMDGGGNNVLLGGQSKCTAFDPADIQESCLEILHTAWDLGAVLLARMHQDGVQDVLWQGYYHLPNDLTKLNVALDIGVEGIRDICEDAPVNCHFVDVRPAFAGRPELVKSDNIHPTDPGSKVLAQEVWKVMVAFGIEQNQPR